MNDFVTQLYPSPAIEHKNEPQFYMEGKVVGRGVDKRPFSNLYLSHNIRKHKGVFVYANFIASIDGRIAIPHPTRAGLMVPDAITNPRDWRLFQELTAQADIIISSGRYLRDYADGRAQEILRTDDPRFADLRDWRQAQGLAPQPDIAIISNSLDFPIPDVLTKNGRKIIIFTTANADPVRIAEIEHKAGQVNIAGKNSVDGTQMVKKLSALGYRFIYSAAGPKILHLLLTSRQLNRLYLTQASKLIGGNPFSSIVEGELFPSGLDLQLYSLYHDQADIDIILCAYDVK